MAKFKKGDRVRCVHPDKYGEQKFNVGDTTIVIKTNSIGITFIVEGGGIMYEDNWELATPSPIPDTVTIGGVEYIRKPKPEHVWAWGQWARVDYDVYHYGGRVIFVVGGKDRNGDVPFSCNNMILGDTDSINPQWLTYISTATTPE